MNGPSSVSLIFLMISACKSYFPWVLPISTKVLLVNKKIKRFRTSGRCLSSSSFDSSPHDLHLRHQTQMALPLVPAQVDDERGEGHEVWRQRCHHCRQADFVPALLPAAPPARLWPRPGVLAGDFMFALRSQAPCAAGVHSFWSSCWSCPWATADATRASGPNFVHARRPTPARNGPHSSARSRSFSRRRLFAPWLLFYLGAACSAIATPPWQRTQGRSARSAQPSAINYPLSPSV
mgnify:CR=1 FL=1